MHNEYPCIDYVMHVNTKKTGDSCNKQQRQIMTKFGVSAHNLNIERGRYIGLKVEERLCKLCYAGIEDEEHFLINCPTLHNTRKHYFDLIRRNCHNFVSVF